jgi:hypothetical protein
MNTAYKLKKIKGHCDLQGVRTPKIEEVCIRNEKH